MIDTGVRVPHGRVRAVLSLSIFGDQEFQWRAWSRHEQQDLSWGDLYGHVAQLYDSLGLLPEPVGEPGQVLATSGEILRMRRLGAVLDPTVAADYVDYDQPDTYLMDRAGPARHCGRGA